MLTKEEIQKKLENDPDWAPGEYATSDDWEMYDEVVDEMHASGNLKDDEDDDEDEDSDW